MKKICLQPGHFNKPGGGAPEEQANNKRIADRLSAMLRERGFEVYQTDYWAYNDPVVKSTDWDLFLSLHCDMDYPNDNGSGFADYPEPSTDSATKESQRICKVINEVYFPEVKINYVNRSNANTRYYYMWKHLTAPTPCVLIEMGQSIDPHDKVLLANTTLIASALTRAICKAFNVAYDIDLQPTEVDKLKKQIVDLKAEIKILSDSVKDLEEQNRLMASEIGQKNLKITELENIIAGYQTAPPSANDLTSWELLKLLISKLKWKK